MPKPESAKVECVECTRGHNGDRSCSAGWTHKRRGPGCYLGTRFEGLPRKRPPMRWKREPLPASRMERAVAMGQPRGHVLQRGTVALARVSWAAEWRAWYWYTLGHGIEGRNTLAEGVTFPDAQAAKVSATAYVRSQLAILARK